MGEWPVIKEDQGLLEASDKLELREFEGFSYTPKK